MLQVQHVELVQTDLVAGLLPRLAGTVDLLVGAKAASGCASSLNIYNWEIASYVRVASMHRCGYAACAAWRLDT